MEMYNNVYVFSTNKKFELQKRIYYEAVLTLDGEQFPVKFERMVSRPVQILFVIMII